MSYFTASNLTAGYDGAPVLKSLSFSLEAGKILGVLGANGSGKTTLLKSICGILPHGGRCLLEGEPLESLSPRRLSRLCGYIPQRSSIAIDISVLDVVTMGFNPFLKPLEHPTAQMEAQARNALEQVGLVGMEARNYLALSEGQKQLCILARTLAAPKKLLLLDEPESALDFRFRHRMLDILDAWRRDGSRSVIIALHDHDLAMNGCDEILLLEQGQVLGKICPASASLEEMEGLLARVYGPVRLHSLRSAKGKRRIIMLRREEEAL